MVPSVSPTSDGVNEKMWGLHFFLTRLQGRTRSSAGPGGAEGPEEADRTSGLDGVNRL